MEKTNGFGRWVRSKTFAVFFFIALFFANCFVYHEANFALHALGNTSPGWWLLLLLLAVLALYERVWHHAPPSRMKKWVLYLGGLYISFFLYWVLCLLAVQLLTFAADALVSYRIGDAVGFCLATVCAAILLIYGLVHGQAVVPVHYTVETGTGEHTRRIVLLSDVHLGMYNGEKHLKHIVDAVNAAKPDLVVIAGDLFDGSQADAYFDRQATAAQFRRIEAEDGVVFVTGNHDPAASDPKLCTFLRDANIHLLDDNGMIVHGVAIFGRNDALSLREPSQRQPLAQAAAPYRAHHPLIVVDHNPQAAGEAAAYGADLVLCGHTHRGQMFPINLFTKWAYGDARFWGHHQLGATHLVVSAGCSVFQLPIRVGTSNEVVSIDLSF